MNYEDIAETRDRVEDRLLSGADKEGLIEVLEWFGTPSEFAQLVAEVHCSPSLIVPLSQLSLIKSVYERIESMVDEWMRLVWDTREPEPTDTDVLNYEEKQRPSR